MIVAETVRVQGDALRPLSNYVTFEPDAEPGERISEGGIVVPPSVRKERQTLGTIRAVGPGRATRKGVEPCTAKPGDRVVVTGMAYTAVVLDTHTVWLMREPEILAFLSE